MSIKIYKSGGTILAEEAGQNTLSFNPGNIDLWVSGNQVGFTDSGTKEVVNFGDYTDIIKLDDTVPSTLSDAIVYLSSLFFTTPVESNGGVPVNIQDQTSPTVIVKFNKVTNSTATTSETIIGSRDIEVTSVTGVSAGSYIVLFSPDDERFSVATVISVTSLTLTVDTPMDFVYPIGTYVDIAVTNMNVNGSITPQTFGLRGVGSPPGVELTVDVTKIIISCLTNSAVDLSKFANITALTNGLVFRQRDGTYENIFNVKSNLEISGICYDFIAVAATNPQQGVDGFIAKITFAGQSEMGVAKRIAIGEDLEFIIQDDLSGTNITKLEIIAEGHLVTD